MTQFNIKSIPLRSSYSYLSNYHSPCFNNIITVTPLPSFFVYSSNTSPANSGLTTLYTPPPPSPQMKTASPFHINGYPIYINCHTNVQIIVVFHVQFNTITTSKHKRKNLSSLIFSSTSSTSLLIIFVSCFSKLSQDTCSELIF